MSEDERSPLIEINSVQQKEISRCVCCVILANRLSDKRIGRLTSLKVMGTPLFLLRSLKGGVAIIISIEAFRQAGYYADAFSHVISDSNVLAGILKYAAIAPPAALSANTASDIYEEAVKHPWSIATLTVGRRATGFYNHDSKLMFLVIDPVSDLLTSSIGLASIPAAVYYTIKAYPGSVALPVFAGLSALQTNTAYLKWIVDKALDKLALALSRRKYPNQAERDLALKMLDDVLFNLELVDDDAKIDFFCALRDMSKDPKTTVSDRIMLIIHFYKQHINPINSEEGYSTPCASKVISGILIFLALLLTINYVPPAMDAADALYNYTHPVISNSTFYSAVSNQAAENSELRVFLRTLFPIDSVTANSFVNGYSAYYTGESAYKGGKKICSQGLVTYFRRRGWVNNTLFAVVLVGVGFNVFYGGGQVYKFPISKSAVVKAFQLGWTITGTISLSFFSLHKPIDSFKDHVSRWYWRNQLNLDATELKDYITDNPQSKSSLIPLINDMLVENLQAWKTTITRAPISVIQDLPKADAYNEAPQEDSGVSTITFN